MKSKIQIQQSIWRSLKVSEVPKGNSPGGSKNQINKEVYDPELETPCPVCGHYGIYRKFRKFDLLDHLNKDHTKKILASFVGREAHFSRGWDMDEETCKQKALDFELRLLKDIQKHERRLLVDKYR